MKMNPNTQEAYELLHNGVLALGRAELQGINVDTDYVEWEQERITIEIDDLESEFKGSKFYKHWEYSSKGKVNMYSDAQLRRFLYGVKKIKPPKQTISGLGSVDEETLSQLNIPELDNLLRIRKLKKIRDTYLEAFVREQVDGYIHPFYNLHIARTYRSSSDSPNFQNIPKRDEESMQTVRKALYPRPGHQLLEIDYSGLEVRIAACYHKDPTMLKYIKDPTTDMHGDMTEQIFLIDDFDKSSRYHDYLRQAVKNGFVFPQFYGDYFGNNALAMACKWLELPQGKWKRGQGKFKVSNHLIDNGITSLTKFTKHIRAIERDFWEERFPVYAEWKDGWWDQYKKRGYIDMLTGFRCSGVMGRNDCINYPVQGAAFHCLLQSFIEVDKMLYMENWKSRLIGQIHDSIILDVYPSELETLVERVNWITCDYLPKLWKWIIVPLKVDAELCAVDASWADKEKYELN